MIARPLLIGEERITHINGVEVSELQVLDTLRSEVQSQIMNRQREPQESFVVKVRRCEGIYELEWTNFG
jgi:cyanophycinase-like exopeptidase